MSRPLTFRHLLIPFVFLRVLIAFIVT